MNFETLEISTPDGTMPTIVARPEGESRGNVLIYMDAMGIRDELVEKFAGRYCEQGFTAVLPDLYYRFGENVSFDATISYTELPEDVQPFFYSLVTQMREDAPIVRDTKLVIDAVNATGGDAKDWGAIGYCMGGRFVVRAMAAYSDDIKAGLAVYPTALVTEAANAPVHDIAQIGGELLVAFGGDDELTPPVVISTVSEALSAAGPQHGVEVYPGAGHAFMMPGKPSSYRHEASEDVWAKSLSIFDRVLNASGGDT